MLLLSAALLASMQITDAPAPVLLEVNDHCGIVADGKAIPVGELGTRIDQWARDGREIRIQFSGQVNASCAYDIVATSKNAHVRRIDFFGNEAAQPEKSQ